MYLRPYNPNSKSSIFDFSANLIGLTLAKCLRYLEPDMDPEEIDNMPGKGGMGQLVEKYYFGYEPNSKKEPDFPHAGVELKVTPLKKNANHELGIKERLVCNTINYHEIILQKFENSTFYKKCEIMLIMFYLETKGMHNKDKEFLYTLLWKIKGKDLEIIKQDFLIIKQKVLDGKAEELTESCTNYLGACKKGHKGDNPRSQPFSEAKAPQRAYSLKPSYMRVLLKFVQSQHSPKVTNLTNEELYPVERIAAKGVFPSEVIEEQITYQDLNSENSDKPEDLTFTEALEKIPSNEVIATESSDTLEDLIPRDVLEAILNDEDFNPGNQDTIEDILLTNQEEESAIEDVTAYEEIENPNIVEGFIPIEDKPIETFVPIEGIEDELITFEELQHDTFDNILLRRFDPYRGKDYRQIGKMLGLTFNDKDKAVYATVVRNILKKGITNLDKTEEFRKAGIKLKTIRLEENGSIREDMSFENIDYKEVLECDDWTESKWYDIITTRFMFVIFRKEQTSDWGETNRYVLDKMFFWSMPIHDYLEAEQYWENIKDNIKANTLWNDTDPDRHNTFWRISDKKHFHVRTKAQNAADTTPSPLSGEPVRKRCYWFSKHYLMDEIKASYGEEWNKIFKEKKSKNKKK